MNISTNEGLILKRLKAIEKSPEDIIKVQCFCYGSFKMNRNCAFCFNELYIFFKKQALYTLLQKMILFISSQAVNADFISGKCCKTTSQSQCSMDHKTNCRLFMNIITSFFFFFRPNLYSFNNSKYAKAQHTSIKSEEETRPGN